MLVALNLVIAAAYAYKEDVGISSQQGFSRL
jgi:hypothetical protein